MKYIRRSSNELRLCGVCINDLFGCRAFSILLSCSFLFSFCGFLFCLFLSFFLGFFLCLSFGFFFCLYCIFICPLFLWTNLIFVWISVVFVTVVFWNLLLGIAKVQELFFFCIRTGWGCKVSCIFANL